MPLMAKMPAAQKKLLIALVVSTPILLGVYSLVRSGSRLLGSALFAVMFCVDFLLLRPKPSMSSPDAKVVVSSRAIWVVGIACFLGSLSLLLNGVETSQAWEVLLGSLGILASGFGMVSLRTGR
jgi:hypothetical protein